MIRAWLIAAAVGGFLSVAAGATAAHLPAGERAAELLRAGALYGMVHAAALIAVTAMAQSRSGFGPALTVAGLSFAAGMLLFSLSLFALALTGREWLAIITPFGGVGLLVGWGALAAHAFSRRQGAGGPGL
jgi:uncharacterized membrane protein YgdD (TMEM256/DUF423 family)